MKCDTEGCDREATVSETLIQKGKRVDRHFCDVCAQKHGIAVQSHPPIADLISKFVMQQASDPESRPARTEQALACPHCRTTWAKFRQAGLLGCAECYDAFDPLLAPLIERAQEGNTRHTGKAPKRARLPRTPPPRAAAVIRRELDKALQAEEYERAARLRDELRRAEQAIRPAPAAEDDPGSERGR